MPARTPEQNRAHVAAWAKRNPEKQKAAQRKWQREHAELLRTRQRAYDRVQRALKKGDLVRGKCEIGGDCSGSIHAHHDDYDKPLDVRWLCHSHHFLLHRRKV